MIIAAGRALGQHVCLCVWRSYQSSGTTGQAAPVLLLDCHGVAREAQGGQTRQGGQGIQVLNSQTGDVGSSMQVIQNTAKKVGSESHGSVHTRVKTMCKNQLFRRVVKPPHRLGVPLLGLPDKTTA